MDSLSNLAVSALAQIGRIISTAESLQNDSLPLAIILVECGKTRGSLLQIQNLLLRSKDYDAGVAYSNGVTEKHAAVLRACSSTFISIDEQLEKLETNETKSKRSSVLGKKLRSLLNPAKDVQIETICHSIRDQTAAIDHLLHTLRV